MQYWEFHWHRHRQVYSKTSMRRDTVCWIAKTNLRKNKVKEITVTNINVYHIIEQSRAWNQRVQNHIDRWQRTKHMQGNSHKYAELNFNKHESNINTRRAISTKSSEATVWPFIGHLNYTAYKQSTRKGSKA